MAVVTRYTNGYPNPNNLSAYSRNAHEAQANLKITYFEIAAQSGDPINSLYRLGRIPSNAMLIPALSNLYAAAEAGMTDFSVGLDDRAGTVSAKALMSDVDVHAGGTFSLVSNVAQANYGKRLWQLLGLASDPGKELDVYATLGAAPSAAGLVNGHIAWTVPGL